MYLGLGQDDPATALQNAEAQFSEKAQEIFVYCLLILGLVAAFVMAKR